MRLWLVLPLLLAGCELLDIEIPEPRNCSSAGSTVTTRRASSGSGCPGYAEPSWPSFRELKNRMQP